MKVIGSRRPRWRSTGVRVSSVFVAAVAATAILVFPAAAAAPGDPARNTCTATTPTYRAGLSARTVQVAGGKALDTAGYDLGTVLGEGDMMVTSADGRYIYTITENGTGGQLQRIEVSTGETRIIAQSGLIETDPDGKQLTDSVGKPVTGWRRGDPIKWLPGGKMLIIGEEASFGRNYEVNPITGEFHALDATGWFEHEGYAFTPDGTFYQGDEKSGGGLYRFKPTTPGDYSAGKLEYLLKSGAWRDAGDPRKVQATQLADPEAAGFKRIEDMEFGPDGMIYATETAFPTDGVAFNVGRVFRFRPGDNVTIETFVANGQGFAAGEFQWPDNIVFDSRGNLIIAEDIPDDTATPPTKKDTKQYNNQQDDLWLVTPDRQAFRLASLANSPKARPCQNEWTGMIFSPDNQTLYVHQQHAENPLLAISGYQAATAGIGPRGAAPGAPNTGMGPETSAAGSRLALDSLAVGAMLAAIGAGFAVIRRRRRR